jgi:hypothetical protein
MLCCVPSPHPCDALEKVPDPLMSLVSGSPLSEIAAFPTLLLLERRQRRQRLDR